MIRFAVLLITLWCSAAWAQHNHDIFHNDYQGWASTKTPNCCNNMDCGWLKDDEWRETATGNIEILIEDKFWGRGGEVVKPGTKQWCKVEQQHLTVVGKSPDGSVPHACIRATSTGPEDTCTRLLCFMGPTRY